MAIVGTAHVVIRALTDKLQSDIQAGLNKSMSGASASGASAGRAFTDGFNSNMRIGDGNSSMDKIGKDAAGAAARAGKEVGDKISDGMSTGARKGEREIVQAAGRAGGSAGNVFGRMFNSSGGGPGRVFISMALRIAALLPLLGALVGGISSVVSGLFAMGAAAGNAVYAFAPLPGLVAALVQGGGAMLAAFSGVGDAVGAGLKAANAPAAQAAKAMDGLKTAARDAAEAVRDAAEAVSDAREAIRDAAEGIRDAKEALSDANRTLRETEEAAAEAIVNANQAVADAKENRRKVHEDAAEAEQEAIERVEDAELALAKSHDRVKKAQEALTDARKAAQERLIDLQFATRGGAIAEQRAIMALQDARYKLNATSELPADNRLRQEAQLAYDEAQLNLEMTQERNGDTAEALQEIREQGVDGTDEVVSAQERLVEAQQGVIDATEGVNDALAVQRDLHAGIAEAVKEANKAIKDAKGALRDAYKDAPEMISDAKEAVRDAREALSDAREAFSDAQESLSDALTALGDAKKNLGGANQAFAAGIPQVNAYQEALDKLSPAARTFVLFIVSLRDEMRRLRDAAATGLFPGLQKAIENLVYGPLFPALEKAMFSTGQSVANAAISISESLSTGVFVGNFSDVVEGNNRTIERMGFVFGDLAGALVAFMDAAQPVTDEFTQWLVQWADGTRRSAELGNQTGSLTEKLQAGAEQMKQLIRITKNLWEGFGDLGAVAATSGQSLLDSFEKATERFAKFTDNKENVRQLREDFDNVAYNLRQISELALVVGGAFFRLGADPAIGDIAKKLQPVVKTLEELVTGLLDRVGDDLVVLLDNVLVAFDEISKSGAIETFLQTMNTAISALITAFQTPVLGDALRLLVKLGAAMYAISILTKFPGVGLLAKTLGLIGRLVPGVVIQFFVVNLQMLARILGSVLLSALSKFGGLLLTLGTKILPLLGRAFLFAMGPWGVAIVGVVALFVLLYKRVDWFREGVQWVMRKVVDAFNWVVDGAKYLWDVLFGNSIFPDLIDAFTAFKETVSGLFSAVAGFFTTTIPNAAQALFNWLTTHWTTVIAIIGGPIGLAVALVVENWEKIKGAFVAVKDWVGEKFAAGWSIVKDKIINPVMDAKDAIGRFFGEGGPVRGFFSSIKDWVMGKFTSAWNGIKDNIIEPIKNAKDKIGEWFGEGGPIRNFFGGIRDWITNTWSGTWNTIKGFITGPIDDAKEAIGRIFNWDGEGGPIKKAFKGAVDGISSIWSGLKEIAAKPVNFVIDTVYNNGLRKALNLLPGVDLAPAGIIEGYASGGVLPGWSPGRDIHQFVSPTAGRLALSGGEAIMRPEFTRAAGGPAGIDRLNRMARNGNLKLPDHGGYFLGGVLPLLGATSISAHKLPYYSTGATWAGDLNSPNDLATPPAAILAWKAGKVAHTFTGYSDSHGRYGNHIIVNHDVGSTLYAHLSSLSAAYGDQVASGEVLGRVGATGNASGAHLHFETHGTKVSGSDLGTGGPGPGEEEKQGWLDKITSIKPLITGTYDAIKGMADKGGYYPLMGQMARGVARDQVQWINDKIPNSIEIPGPNVPMPDNPVPNPFDRGGVAQGDTDVWMPKRTARPERVLSPDQTTAFEKLVAWLDSNGAPGGGGDIKLDVHVPETASARDVVDGIVYELRRMRQGGKYTP